MNMLCYVTHVSLTIRFFISSILIHSSLLHFHVANDDDDDENDGNDETEMVEATEETVNCVYLNELARIDV